jgi:pimeloyl-ACP methyl ester carboxylesterase
MTARVEGGVNLPTARWTAPRQLPTLHTLLERAHVPCPHVLAGHSFGGLYILTFAANYPDQVAGMVLLDSTAPASAPGPPTKTGSHSLLGRISTLLPAFAHLGMARLYAQFSYGTLPHGLATKRAPEAEPPAMSRAPSTISGRGRWRCGRAHPLLTLAASRSS